MEMNLYAVKDVLADEYAPLFEAKNDQVALRVCHQMFAKFPDMSLSSFQLFKLGKFDHASGSIVVLDFPLPLNQSFEVNKEVKENG